jgi:hypothetical protein
MMFRLDKGKGREPLPLLLPVLHGEKVGMRALSANTDGD